MKPKILIVDDDPSLVNMMTANLEAEGYEVIAGYDGQAAFQLAKKHQPQLIVMDVNMPLINGIRAMELIRQNPQTMHIPIILLTGEQSDTVFPKVQAVDRVTHIKKPVDLEDLNSLVRQYLQQNPPSSGTQE